MAPKQTDLRARVSELEATVSGLTQELVEATERIRQLEAAAESEAGGRERREPGVGSDGEEATKQMSDGGEADDETGSDLDGIIVA